jgi:hypothetical protein
MYHIYNSKSNSNKTVLWGKDLSFPQNPLKITETDKNSRRQGAPEQARRRLTYVSQAACEEQRSIRGFLEGLITSYFRTAD